MLPCEAMANLARSRLAPVLLLVASIAGMVAAAEWALDAAGLPERPGPLAWKTTVPWSEGVNTLGFRGKNPARGKRGERLLLLGDSQIEGYHVRRRDTFGPKLKRYLQHRGWEVDLVSLGAGGWGTDQQLIALREYGDLLEPDLVVIFYTFTNDVWNSLFPTHMGTPKPTFRLDGDTLVPPDAALWRAPQEPTEVAAAHHGLGALWRRATTGYPSDADWEDVLPAPVEAPPAGGDLPSLAEAYRAAFGLELWEGEDLHTELSHFAHLKEPATPRLQHGMRLQRALFAEMKRECAARGIPLYVFRPLLAADFWEGEFEHGGRAYRLSGRAAAKRLREMFASLDIPLLEIDDLGPEHTWLPKDKHLNPLGNRTVAARVGDWLLAQRAAGGEDRSASFAPTPP